MAYTDPTPFKIPRRFENKGGLDVTAITEDVTLTYKSGQYQIFTLTSVSAKTCILPAPVDGASFTIRNAAASNQIVNVNDHNGATLASLAATGEYCICFATDADWHLIGKGT